MPSGSVSTWLEDVPTLCPHTSKFINADITQGQSLQMENSTVSRDEFGVDQWENSGRESEPEGRKVAADQRNWIRPDLPSRCTWRLGAPSSESPHSHQTR